jgi:hypothetical protein
MNIAYHIETLTKRVEELERVVKKDVVPTDVKPGIYRVFWKSGESSLAAIGMAVDGSRWLAPINWVCPGAGHLADAAWKSVNRLEEVLIK